MDREKNIILDPAKKKAVGGRFSQNEKEEEAHVDD